MGVLQHGRFILPFLTKRWIHNRLEIENRLVLGSKIILKNWAKRAAWGMWDIKPALYDNEVKNCLVATYGIQGLARKARFFSATWMYILTMTAKKIIRSWICSLRSMTRQRR